MQEPTETATESAAPPPRRWALALKTLGGVLMLASILVVLFGSWAISASNGLVLLCTLGWIGGFALFIFARSSEV